MNALALSGDQNNAYWSVIAQVVPVFALALVLESRVLAKRWSRKKAFAAKTSRAAWAWAMVFASVLMTAVMGLALRSLAAGESQSWESDLATAFVTILLLMVVSLPISSITGLALVDVLATSFLNSRLSKHGRMRRTIPALREDLNRLQRSVLINRVEALAYMAILMVSHSQRFIRRVVQPVDGPDEERELELAIERLREVVASYATIQEEVLERRLVLERAASGEDFSAALSEANVRTRKELAILAG